ncbi:hypothetical protein ACJIZ3_025866 [Penstemon smallii]|uniref:Glycosyltransferase n=1 Tax=Penstemon smallii TaxID=265156 RepID=A0ABD3TWS8_9LAMI
MASKSQENEEQESSPQVVVVMVPLPAQGHLNQLLHLSRLISAHDITVYYVGTTTHTRQAKLRVHGWDPSSITNIHFQEFPTTPFDNPSPNPNTPIKFPSQIMPSLNATTNLRKPIYEFTNKLSRTSKRVVVIYDALMSYVVQDIDNSVPNAELYCFRSISAITVFHWEAAKLDLLPSGPEFFKEIVSSESYFSPEFGEFRNLQRGARNVSSGDIFNSNRGIEGLYLDLLAKGKAEKMWAIGPFNPIKVKKGASNHKSLDFLEKQEQEPNSVILVSFGTTSSLPDKQIEEIAHGLERSEQKFIWVIRDADKGDIFRGEVRKAELPKGFEERVKERGIVVRDWAPQLEILGHSSIGGFMSHCGWNSCMESISMGVPLATWPLHSDQPGNAALITKVLKIGVQVKNWTSNGNDDLVLSSNVELAVRKLMASPEGDEMRKRAAELGDAVKKSAAEGKEMDSFITHITR